MGLGWESSVVVSWSFVEGRVGEVDCVELSWLCSGGCVSGFGGFGFFVSVDIV